MAFIDVPALLQPIHPDSPCGPDLEYAPLHLEAARAVEGSPDAEYGAVHVAAADPDWALVKAATLDLLAQSLDLRLAVWLTRALVALHGIAAVADGCALIEGLLAQHWDHVHPQLDADDGGDPTARLNALLALDETTGFVRELRMAPLAGSARHGRVSLRDIKSTEGEQGASDAAQDPAAVATVAIDRAAVDTAFAESNFDELSQLCDALASAQASLTRIDALLTERLGHGRSVALRSLEQVLARIHQTVQRHLAQHPQAAFGDGALPGPTAANVGGSRGNSDAVTSREDVLHSLDRLCAYYEVAEPSSPVPVLLQRARELVGMRFVDIVSVLTPAGVEQARHWAGSEHA
ncbi:type VI secretion system protein TssA [Trinickia soli]|nr:type VI secretion system protein TssA [Trinickia soli]